MSASQPFALDSVEATSIKELVEEIERSRHKARKIKVIFLGRFLMNISILIIYLFESTELKSV